QWRWTVRACCAGRRGDHCPHRLVPRLVPARTAHRTGVGLPAAAPGVRPRAGPRLGIVPPLAPLPTGAGHHLRQHRLLVLCTHRGRHGRGGVEPAHRDRGLPARRAQVPVLGGLLLTRGVRAALRWRARGTAQGRVRPRRAVRDTVREGGWRTMTMTIGEMIEAFATGEPPLRITAYDGSAVGPADSPLELRLKS